MTQKITIDLHVSTLGNRAGEIITFFSGAEVSLNPLGMSAAREHTVPEPRMVDNDDFGGVGRMKIDRRNGRTPRKPVSMQLCPPKIPHDLTWDQTRPTAV
jgi:hypothetical protein